MTLGELIIYGIKKYIDYLSKRSIYAWGIRYFSISLVAEILKASNNEKIQFIYTYLQDEVGVWLFILVWFIIEILLGGFSIIFIWISIPIKLGLIVLFSFLHYKKTTRDSVFLPNKEWFNQIYSKYYSDDIKLKYVEDLHHITNAEKSDLRFILEFDKYKIDIIENIIEVKTQVDSFIKGFKEVQMIIRNGDKKIPDFKDYQTLPSLLNTKLPRIKVHLRKAEKELSKNHYKSIDNKYEYIEIVELKWIDFKPRRKKDFENWTREEQVSFNKMIQAFNYLHNSLKSLNYSFEYLNQRSLFISGNAGVGKTHLAAHLTKTLKTKGDYPIFLKAELFSGNEIRFDTILPKILDVPSGYSTSEILQKLNRFARKKNSRVFIIIDALNETTDNNIGFSKIWRIHLQNFSNQLLEFSNLFAICTLRTSYIDRIWSTFPNNLITLKGFETFNDREEACQRYFNYYNIKVNNLDTADLSHFRNPLLLELYCKLINESREEGVNIDLNIEAYITVFEDYISKLKEEVRVKKNLAVVTPINVGFNNSSERFLNNNEAFCTIDEFVLDFDQNLNVSEDDSIAKAILEGYLIFIKDFIESQKSEIVQFTQQEIGGFVLANKLQTDFPNIDDLLASDSFNKQLIGNNTAEQHQLRYDVLKFLIALNPEIITKVAKKEIIDLSWWYLYNANNVIISDSVLEHIKNIPDFHKQIFQLVEASEAYWLREDHPYNFNFILEILQRLSQWEYDISWNQYIYYDGGRFHSFINEYLREIQKGEINSKLLLKSKIVITILSSNIRELRDKATLALLKFGMKYPLEFLELLDIYKGLPDIYIYERLIQCCYGIVMIKQNDLEFNKNVLPVYADTFFKYQFSSEPTNPVYNYIVIDSIKHIIDLAVYKGVYTLLDQLDSRRVSVYNFIPPKDWVDPTFEQQEIVNNSSEMSPPEPLRMDFGIYTIPRLIDTDTIDKDVAIANVWSRILEIGYLDIDFNQKPNIDKDFFWGQRIYRIEGKIDRLGKKYCWIAFFDYAGKLLLDNNLDIWKKGDSLYKKHYERLGDIDIDISYPSKKYIIKKRLFFDDLLKEKKENSKNWNHIDKIDLCTSLFDQDFDGNSYKMLYGFIDQRLDKSYDTRSFLMINTLLIDKNQLINLKSLNGKLYCWDHDIHMSPNYLYNVYFGELYWADTLPILKQTNEFIPNGLFKQEKKILNERDLNKLEYRKRKIGEEVIYDLPEKVDVNSEPTLMDFIWESNSKTFEHFSEHIPSVNIGKSLGLKPDCETGKILDSELNESYKCIEFKDSNHFSNNFNYLRSDLLQQYMDEKNLTLLYQVKQFSYGKDLYHYRKLKFFI